MHSVRRGLSLTTRDICQSFYEQGLSMVHSFRYYVSHLETFARPFYARTCATTS